MRALMVSLPLWRTPPELAFDLVDEVLQQRRTGLCKRKESASVSPRECMLGRTFDVGATHLFHGFAFPEATDALGDAVYCAVECGRLQ